MNNSELDPTTLEMQNLQNNADSWHSRYLELQQNYRAVRKKNREQAKMSRQLIEAVKNKLQETDRYISEVSIYVYYIYDYSLYPILHQVVQIKYKLVFNFSRFDRSMI